MKLALLTTETVHHSFLVREFAKKYPDSKSYLELKTLTPAFPISHPYETSRDGYETKKFFDGNYSKIPTFTKTEKYTDINSSEAIASLKQFSPDFLIVFGTGKIGLELIKLFPNKILNLHGGDPQLYRGLDSHFWAVYHNDFNSLKSCLHYIDENLDTGNIISLKNINILKNMKFHQLRAANVELALDMTLQALDEYKNTKKIKSTKQSQVGRYYSFMPTVLKDICVNKFDKYTADISHD